MKNHSYIRFVAAFFLIQFWCVAQTRSQLVIEDEERMKLLTAFVSGAANDQESKDGNTDIWGAGIIVGMSAGKYYIATAQHVIAGLNPSAIYVQFYKMEGKFPARVVAAETPPLDLAVLVVDGVSFTSPLPFDHVGVATPNTDVYMIGHPNHYNWEISGKPDGVTRVEDGKIFFQSALVMPGQSGGALIANNLRFLVGMTISDDPPHGVAIAIETILSKLTDWKITFEKGLGPAVGDPLWSYKCRTERRRQ
jgi:hypothetical protein